MKMPALIDHIKGMPYIGEAQPPRVLEDALDRLFSKLTDNKYVVSSSYDPVTKIADIVFLKTVDVINISVVITQDGAILFNATGSQVPP
jgi:hypothetical protein